MVCLPLFNFPTTITWVDDDALFLNAGKSVLQKSFLFNTFNDPNIALQHFKNYVPIIPKLNFFRGCTEHETYDAVQNTPVELDINALHDLVANPKIQKDISVLIVDYNMPGMTGIELCRQLKSLPMKKILLTGEVENKNAVAAFNEGIIDRFVRKDSPMLIEEISSYLDVLTQEYLLQHTKNLSSFFNTMQNTPFTDPIFIKFFEGWCNQYKIKEYYVIDKQGNFLTINDKGERAYFVTHTDYSLDNFVELNNDEGDIDDLINRVTQRKVIPFFGIDKEAWQFETTNWQQYFYPSNIINGKMHNYYWTTVPA